MERRGQTRRGLQMSAFVRPPAPVEAGQAVALLGGSFNPAHDGHLHMSRLALTALDIDQVWWLVSPQNPLKPQAGMAPLSDRLASARAVAAADRRIAATAIEAELGTRYAVDTVRALRTRFPEVHSVWLMGSDLVPQLPRWRDWRRLLEAVPVAVVPRPGHDLKARLSPVAQLCERLDSMDARGLARFKPPAICFLEGTRHPASSTEIRAAAGDSWHR